MLKVVVVDLDVEKVVVVDADVENVVSNVVVNEVVNSFLLAKKPMLMQSHRYNSLKCLSYPKHSRQVSKPH